MFLAGAAAASAAVIPGEYIVQLDPKVTGVQMYRHLESMGISASDVTSEWNINNEFVGYAFKNGNETQRLMIEENPAVLAVYNNEEVHALECADQSLPTGLWGLSRVSNRQRESAPRTFRHDTRWGNGVISYILDTGIRATHVDLERNTRERCASFISGEQCNQDGNGHGTHVAGTVGGQTHGVAKDTTLVDVKVLSRFGSGSFQGIIDGINWVVEDCRSQNLNGVKCVANMSLGGSGSGANAATTAAANAGVVMVVASGNSNANACNFTPAGAGGNPNTGVLSVNSMDVNDNRSSFSNFGTCTDVFGPGSSILSAWHTSDTATNTISGTSMASPHVAGVAAAVLGENTFSTTVAAKTAITSSSVSGQIGNPGTGSPNLLANLECA